MKGRLALVQTAGTLATTSCATLERRFGVRFSVGHQRVEGPESDNTGDHDCSALGIIVQFRGSRRTGEASFTKNGQRRKILVVEAK